MPKTKRPYRVVDPADLDPRGGPRQLVIKAVAAGFIVEVRSPRKPKGVISIGGIRDLGDGNGLAFTATWVDGKVTGCSLYGERDEGYREVPAPKTAMQGRGLDRKPKATGYDRGVRLVYNGGPRGIVLSITELRARMAAL